MDFFKQQDPAIDRKRRLAEAMIGQGMQGGPVHHWAQGLGRIAKTAAGSYLGKQADDEAADFRQSRMDKLSQVLAGMNKGDEYGDLSSSLASISPEMALQTGIAGVQSRAEQTRLAQQRQQELADEARRREQDLEDYETKRQIDQRYPAPETPMDQYLQTLAARQSEMDIEETEAKLDETRREQEAAEKSQQKGVRQAESLLTLANDVLNDKDGLAAYSGVSGMLPTTKPSTKSFEAKLNRLMGALTLENIDLLTGVLSDSDIKLLQNAATSVVEGGELGENEAEIKRIINALEAGLGRDVTDWGGGGQGRKRYRYNPETGELE